MYRNRLLAAVMALALVGALVGTSFAGSAQDATPAPGQHPLVGTWIVDPESENPGNAPSFDVFMADGTLVNVGSDGTSVGAWEATGPTTAIFTFTGLMGDQGAGGMFVIRGEIEVAADGQSFTATHAFSMLLPDGTVAAAYPGGGGTGSRMTAQGPDQWEAPLPGFIPWTPASPEATPSA